MIDYKYRGFTIVQDSYGWEYYHDEFDGAPDAPEPYCLLGGRMQTKWGAEAQVDDIHDAYPSLFDSDNKTN